MTVQPSEVLPGDVLLFHGRGFVSWAIRKFDGTEVNHAAVALGDGMIGEAAGEGLRRRTVEESVTSNDFTVVRRLIGSDVSPVATTANAYLSGRVPYAYHALVLLAILSSVRRIPLPGAARRLVRSVLDHAAAALNAYVDAGSKLMICSEYVYRCYDEASYEKPNPYRLDVLTHGASFGMTTLPAGGDDESFLSWALSQPSDMVEQAAVQAFGTASGTVFAIDEEMVEQRLAPLIYDYGMKTNPADPELEALAPAAFAMEPAAATEEEPTDEELLSSMAAFSTALDQQRTGSAEEYGVGQDVLRGALQGLRDVSADPNFVTPGDLLKTDSLDDLGRVTDV
jgi:hypothetical protein